MYSFEVVPAEIADRLAVPLYRARHVIQDLEASGKIPIRRLGDIVDIASGNYLAGYVDKGLPYLRVDNIREYICNLNAGDVVFVKSDIQGLTDRIIVVDGDVLIARTGTLGKASLAMGELVGAVMSQHVTRLTLKNKTRWSAGYLAAFLNSDLGKYQLIYSGYGSTRQELTHSALQDVRVPEAGQTEQRRVHRNVESGVVSMNKSLERFRAAVASIEAAVGVDKWTFPSARLFEADRAAADADLWTPRYHRPMFVSLVEALRRDFDCSTVGQLASVQRGKGTRVSDYATKGIPFIRTSSLVNFGIDPFPDHYASDDIHEFFDQPVQVGDILFSIEGKIGSVGYLTSEDACVFKNHIELVRPNDRIDPLYLFLLLASRIGSWQATRNMVVQATLPGMANRLRDIVVPLTPRDGKRRQRFGDEVAEALAIAEDGVKYRELGTRVLRSAGSMVEHLLEQATSS